MISGGKNGKCCQSRLADQRLLSLEIRIPFRSSTVSGTNYHDGRKELYYFNRDSILIFNLRTRSSETIIFSEPCPVDLRLGTNFIDQRTTGYTVTRYITTAPIKARPLQAWICTLSNGGSRATIGYPLSFITMLHGSMHRHDNT
jgi:hypothetical protein